VLILQLDSHERYNIWCLPLQRAVRKPYRLMIAPSVQRSWRSHILEQLSVFLNGSWTLTSKAKKTVPSSQNQESSERDRKSAKRRTERSTSDRDQLDDWFRDAIVVVSTSHLTDLQTPPNAAGLRY
jgi:agmatine/peptidylarginine deiminase